MDNRPTFHTLSREMSELKSDISVLKTEMSWVRNELKDFKLNISEDLRSVERTNNELLKFMYKYQGGKAWLFGLMTVAGTVGALFSAVVTYILPLPK